ncbi:MAG: hypothetical protein P8X89_07830 [Reinekea sp.]
MACALRRSGVTDSGAGKTRLLSLIFSKYFKISKPTISGNSSLNSTQGMTLESKMSGS